MREIKLSVRELVEFVYKSGDLNSGGFEKSRSLEGINAHKLLQSQMDDTYQKEYYLKDEFVHNDIRLIIEGRADGILVTEDRVIIDEIKSTYRSLEFIDENYNLAHSAQAKCYGYIYARQTHIDNITIQVRYYNLDTLRTKVIEYNCTFKELESFFYDLIDRYVQWINVLEEVDKKKLHSIEKLKFPFSSYRTGQRDFSVAVYQTILNNSRLFAQAPTGVGKTISVLFPAIKSVAAKSNSKIYYLTAKSSTKQIAAQTLNILYANGLKVLSTLITAKEKICPQAECNCDPEVCKYAKDYYTKLSDKMLSIISENYFFTREKIEDIAKQIEVCPFELSLDLSYMSDIVICDYNYYFDPRVAFQREDLFFKRKDILLIDEAHNLDDRARNMYSCEVIKEDYYEILKEFKSIDNTIYKVLKKINTCFINYKKAYKDDKVKVLEKEPSDLILAMKSFVEKYEEWSAIRENKDKLTNSKVEELYFNAVFFIRLSEMVDENFCYYITIDKNTKIKLFLINPAEILSSIVKKAKSAIFFSATLTPLKYFRYLLGGDDKDKILMLKSPYPIDNLNLMINGSLSMKYTNRDNNIDPVCQQINTVLESKLGNYFIFFPSYSYLNKCYERYCELYGDSNIILNSSSLNEDEQINIIKRFDELDNQVLFTVVGGSFSEGVDLPGDKLIGAVIIGTGIPQINFERNLIKEFYDKQFGMGFDYAYKYPGFNKILQSAGRVIRTESDKGSVLLIDSRLLDSSYLRLFPRHWRNCTSIYNDKQLEDMQEIFWYDK